MARYQRILLGTDFSEQAKPALTEATRLAQHHAARLHIVHVDVTPLQGGGDFGRPVVPRYLQDVAESTRPGGHDSPFHGTNAVLKVMRDSSEAAGILRYADEQHIDLIVMGTHGYGALAEMLIGSVAQAVARQARVPVLIVGSGSQASEPCVLASVDHPLRAGAALAEAARIAVERSARLVALHVVDFGRVEHPESLEIGEREQRARDELARTVAAANLPLPVEPLVTVGPAADEIVRIAVKEGAGLIVMSPSSHTPVERLLLGSVCKSVIRAAPCPVLMYRDGAASLQSAAA